MNSRSLSKRSRRANLLALASAGVLTAAVLSATPAHGSTSTGDHLIKVTARVETPPDFDDEAGGDADADDPAIWVNREHKSRSLVITTAKNAGLRVYDLHGRLVQSVPAPAAPGADDEPGRFNNVDIVRHVRLGGRTQDVAVTSDRGRDQIRFYAINPRSGRLTDITVAEPRLAFSADQAEVNDQQTIYGLDVYRDDSGAVYIVGTRRHTSEIGLFKMVSSRGRLGYERVDTLAFPDRFTLPDGTTWTPCGDPGEGPQLEGLVVDEATSTLYAAQEDIGLWRVQLATGRFSGKPRSIERTQTFGVAATYDETTEECVADGPAPVPGYGGRIAADVEGLTIYRTGRRDGTLVVSSQGDNTFYTYDRRTNRPLRHFAVVDGPRTDGSQDCDGGDVVSTPLPGYPHGLLVVQDGDDTPHVADGSGEDRTSTNFKYLDAQVLTRRGEAVATSDRRTRRFA